MSIYGHKKTLRLCTQNYKHAGTSIASRNLKFWKNDTIRLHCCWWTYCCCGKSLLESHRSKDDELTILSSRQISAYSLLQLFYNVFFHPLSSYPGPSLYGASRLPYLYHMARGDLTFKLLPLHEKYGPVVRIAPDELSFTHPDAWKDIYGHRVGNNHNVLELPKAGRFYRTRGTLPNIISEEDRAHHGLVRRVLSHGFSDKHLRARESVIMGYAEKLIRQLRKFSAPPSDEEASSPVGSVPMNMTAWYNWVTVDIISDLAFGEPSGCLDHAEHDPWVDAMNNTVLDFIPLQILAYLGLGGFMNRLIRAFMNTNRKYRTYYPESMPAGKDLPSWPPGYEMTDNLTSEHADLKVSAEKVVRRVGRKYIRTLYHLVWRLLGSGVITASFCQIACLVKFRIQILYHLK